MTTKTMPTWVADQLITNGQMTRDRITHTAKPRTCQRCWAKTLTGLTDLGILTNVDPTPINALGEAIATVTGRTTYGCFYGELTARDPHEITYRPTTTRPVYATHQCHTPPLPAETKFIQPTLTTPDADTHPPF